MERDGADHVRGAGFLPFGGLGPDDLVEVDQVDRPAAGQERVPVGEGAPGADEDAGPEGRIHLVPAPRQVVRGGGHRAVGRQLGGVDQDRDIPLVGHGDDGIDVRAPSRDVGRRGDRQQGGTGPGVELGGHLVGGEGAVGAALDEPARAGPGPRQQVGVVLHDGGDHDVVGGQAEAVGEVVDGLGRVPAEDGDVVTLGVASGEGQGRSAGQLVGGGGLPGPVAGAPVDAGVGRQEVVHPLGHGRQRRGRGPRVEVQVRPVDAVDAGHRVAVTHEGGRQGRSSGHGVTPIGTSGRRRSAWPPPTRRARSTSGWRCPRPG